MFVTMRDLDETATYVTRRLGRNNHAESLSAVALIKPVKYSDATSTHSVLAQFTMLFYFSPTLKDLLGDAHPSRPHREEEFPFQHDSMSVTYLPIDLMSFISSIHTQPGVTIYTCSLCLCISMGSKFSFLRSLFDLSLAHLLATSLPSS